MGRLVIISNRLPIAVKKVDGKLEYAPSVGGLSSALASYTESGSNRWIGWPGIAKEDVTDEEIDQITKTLKKKNCYPLFFTKKQIDGFYNGFSNGALWPVFHRMQMGSGASEANWKMYQEVNQLYADEALRLSRGNDSIWVHDYQLMLLPEMLRIHRPKSQIGFFLHIPFPDAKNYFKLPHAEAMLRGVLGADLVGLHTSSYVESFLDCCKQAHVGIVGNRKVALSVRVVRVADFPIGINYRKFAEASKSLTVEVEYRKLLLKYRGKKVILTIDRLDPSKGLEERLVAYQTLLAENPKLHRKVVFIMQAVPSRTDIKEYQDLRVRVDKLIEDINTTFGTKNWRPVETIFSALPFEKFNALYRRADVAFIAPIRDGMNLVAKEYLASRPKHDGVLVLSETAGAAEELRDAIMVNPMRPRTMVNGLKKALLMKPDELKARTKRMQRHLQRHTVDRWVTSFISAMEAPIHRSKLSVTRSLIGAPEKALVSDYHQARSRLILLDYDGTLHPKVASREEAKPTSAVTTMLKRLGSEKNTKVALLSGRSRDTLSDWFGGLPITLIAEHGAFIKEPAWKKWRSTTRVNDDWQQEVAEILSYYTELTPGSFVRRKEKMVVWNYTEASAYSAQKNLVAIKRLLRPITRKEKLIMRSSRKTLEIKHKDISKAHISQEWLLTDQDFVLAVGDDTTDEDMFRAVSDRGYTVKVGRGRTKARWRLPNPASVLKMLRKL